jgi:diaminopimelate decarboxylase
LERVARLVAGYFASSAGELLVGGVPVGALAAAHGTPLFAYDAGVLDRKWTLLREALPPEFAIAYSVKANPSPRILRHFLAKGSLLEVASGGELRRAAEAGCPPERIFFAGPGKTEAELELALRQGIREIHAESPLELRRIGEIARRLDVRARVAVRVNPGVEVQGGAMRMGGKPTPFGVDEESLDTVLDPILRDAAIDLRGLHVYAGTQILDPVVLARQYRRALDIARRVAERVGHPLHTLDFGGGLGIPYFPGEVELDMAKLREELRALMAEVEGDPRLAGTELLVEPGRYLVGEAGVYITRLLDLKVSRGKTFLVVDGGMNHHLAASGNLGQVIKRNFPVAVVNRLEAEPTVTADIVGPLCTPLDTLARDLPVPSPSVGDLIGIFQSGAYALTASPVDFLGHPFPAEVLVQNGRVDVIRARGSRQP